MKFKSGLQKEFLSKYEACPKKGLLFKKTKDGLKIIGTNKDRDGYFRTNLRMLNKYGKASQQRLHRLLFFIYYGYFPEQVDHINGDRADNRKENLRATDHFGNMQNKLKEKKHAPELPVGVSYKPKMNKYHARFNKKPLQLSVLFDTASEAIEQRLSWEKQYG